MCAGLRDAENLAWKLAGVLGALHAFAARQLSSERYTHVRAVIKQAVQIGELFKPHWVKAFMRDTFCALASWYPN